MPRLRVLVASLLLAAPLAAQQEFVTQTLMVPTFHGPDVGQAHKAADIVRNRVADASPGRDLRVVSAGAIATWLERSGFDEDMVLGPAEMDEMARHFRADERITGTVTRTGGKVRVEAHLTLPRDPALDQPLISDGPSVEAAARAVAEQAVAARRQLIPLRRCENAIRADHLDEAARDAAAGIAAYPPATLARTCLLRALAAMPGEHGDSVIAVARAILAVTPDNPVAIEDLALALDARRDYDAAGDAWVRLLATDSLDVSLLMRVGEALSREGNARRAEPLVARGSAAHPDDLPLLKLAWLVHLATSNWKDAIVAGEALNAKDAASRSDPDFYLRLASAYRADSQPERALATAAVGVSLFRADAPLYSLYVQLLQSENAVAVPRGLVRFPDSGDLHAIAAQTMKAQGDLAGAVREMRAALGADPSIAHGFLQLADYEMALSRPDSALVAIQQALAHGEAPAMVAQFALARGNELYAAANGAKQRAAFERAHRFLALARQLVPSAQAQFLLGASALSVGQYAATEAPAGKRCDLSRLADSSLAEAEENLTGGREVAPDAARQFLDYVTALRPYVANQIKTFCPAPGGAGVGRTVLPLTLSGLCR